MWNFKLSLLKHICFTHSFNVCSANCPPPIQQNVVPVCVKGYLNIFCLKFLSYPSRLVTLSSFMDSKHYFSYQLIAVSFIKPSSAPICVASYQMELQAHLCQQPRLRLFLSSHVNLQKLLIESGKLLMHISIRLS